MSFWIHLRGEAGGSVDEKTVQKKKPFKKIPKTGRGHEQGRNYLLHILRELNVNMLNPLNWQKYVRHLRPETKIALVQAKEILT